MMKNFIYAARQVFKFKGANFVKLFSLALGLVAGGTFAARVAFEQSYDNYLPDVERLYRLELSGKYGELEIEHDPMVMAPMAPALKASISGIESATRFYSNYENTYRVGDKFFKINTISVDSCLFDVLDFGIISGNPKEELAVPGNAFISEKYATMIFGERNPVGESLIHENGTAISIKGVFKTIPENSHLKFDIAIAKTSPFPTGWNGGDAYRSYFKLHKGVDPVEIDKAIPAVIAANVDAEALKARGIDFKFNLEPVRTLFTRDTAGLNLIMSLIALVLIAVGALNYVLMSISSLSARAKEIGVHKANGATNFGIFSLILWETFIYIILSICLGTVMLIIFKSQVENIAGHYVNLFSAANMWALGIVVVVLFLFAGIIPAWIFSRIPVAQIFRRYTDNKSAWKKTLLFFQFLSASFILSLLVIIILQYSKITSTNTGYNYDNVAFTTLALKDKDSFMLAASEIERMPFVKRVALANSIPAQGTKNGIGISDLEAGEHRFSGAQFQTDPRFFELFEIPIMQGRGLLNESDSTICIFDQEAATTLKRTLGKDPLNYVFKADGEVQTVGGIAQNVKFSSYHVAPFPVVYTCIQDWERLILFIKFDEISGEKMGAVVSKLRGLFPESNFEIAGYKQYIESSYEIEKKFKDGISIASIILILIAFIGVTGYTSTEIRRRSREIAVRKIYGATSVKVISTMTKGILALSIISSTIGAIGAYFVGEMLLGYFYLKTPLFWWIFAIAAGFIVLLVIVSVTLQTWHIANDNPAKSIKSE